MFEKRVVLVVLATGFTCTAAFAQQPAPAAQPPAATSGNTQPIPDGGMPAYIHSETPEQRRSRLGTPEDPGLDPDPNKHYWRFGHSFHIEKFERKWAQYDQPDPAFIRPFAPVNVVKELYQQNEKWVWVWMGDPEPVDEATEIAEASKGMTSEQLRYFQDIRAEFSARDVPESGKTIRFQESSEGLPTGGSYRNSLAVADMNGDGCPDIITPPQRGGNGIPEIYLGDCKGHWKRWANTTWPYRLDYGSVVAADFNKDGHMDLAFGVHLNGVYVFLGDGKGNFVDSSAGLPNDYPTRRVSVADVDHDGYPDLVALSEGPAAARTGLTGGSKMRVFLNRNKGKSWESVNVAPDSDDFGGDWLSIGKFNRGPYPDFVAASVYFNGPAILWESSGKGQWKNVGAGTLVPWLSYYFANATGRFTSKKLDDAIVSFVRTWPDKVDQRVIPPPANKSVSGIDRISFSGKEPQRTPIVRWTTSRPIWAMAAADLDGDGNLDLIYIRPDPREVEILLGDGKGHFTRANVEGLTLAPNTTYDIKVADVDGDGRPDIILAYETASLTTFAPRDGSIHVFLNRGVAPAAAEAKK
jgi:FG-GAP-like repeat